MNKFIVKAKNAIANKKAEMYVSKAVWVVGVLIIGALLVWGCYNIFNVTVLPQLDTNIKSFFATAKTQLDAGSANKAYTPASGN